MNDEQFSCIASHVVQIIIYFVICSWGYIFVLANLSPMSVSYDLFGETYVIYQ